MSSKYFAIPKGTQLQTSKSGGKGVTLNGQWIVIPKNLVDAFEAGAQHLLADARESTQTVTGKDAQGNIILADRPKPVTLLFATAVGTDLDEMIRVAKSTEIFEARANAFVKAETKKFLAEYQLTDSDLSVTV